MFNIFRSNDRQYEETILGTVFLGQRIEQAKNGDSFLIQTFRAPSGQVIEKRQVLATQYVGGFTWSGKVFK